jgi:hypothetical protein
MVASQESQILERLTMVNTIGVTAQITLAQKSSRGTTTAVK